MTTEPTTITALDNNFNFPLYLYNTENTLDTKTRTPNLNQEIIKQIEQKLNLKFIEDHELPVLGGAFPAPKCALEFRRKAIPHIKPVIRVEPAHSGNVLVGKRRLRREGRISTENRDNHLAQGLNVHAGHIYHKAVATDLGFEFTDYRFVA